MLPREELIDVLLNQEQELDAAADRLNQRRDRLDSAKPYTLLQQHCDAASVSPDLEKWFGAAAETTPAQPDDMNCLEFGGTRAARSGSIHVDAWQPARRPFQEILLELWLAGVDITWEIFYPETSFHKIPLPPYPFQGTSFWLAGEPEQKKDKIIQYKQTLTGADPLVREHVITGKPLIPGAVMIRFGLEAVRRAVKGPVTALRNVVFKSPGLVRDKMVLEVDVSVERRKFVLKLQGRALCEGEYA